MESANGNTFKIESDSDTWMTFLDHKWVYLLGKFVGSFLSRAKFCEFRIIEIIAIENAYFWALKTCISVVEAIKALQS